MNSRAVRDCFNTISRKLKAKLTREANESGGGDMEEPTELEALLEELLKLSEESEKKAQEKLRPKRRPLKKKDSRPLRWGKERWKVWEQQERGVRKKRRSQPRQRKEDEVVVYCVYKPYKRSSIKIWRFLSFQRRIIRIRFHISLSITNNLA